MDFSLVLYLLVHIHQSLFNVSLNFRMFRSEALIRKLDFINLYHSAVLSLVHFYECWNCLAHHSCKALNNKLGMIFFLLH